MKNNTKNQNVGDLIQGIESILSKDCCPLNDEEKVVLQKCVDLLRSKDFNKVDLAKVAKWLLMFLRVADGALELFL